MKINIQKILFAFIFSISIIFVFLNSNWGQKKIINLYLDNNILFHDYQIITDQFEYDFFDNTFISDICVLNKESNFLDTILYTPRVRLKLSNLFNINKSNTFYIDSLLIEGLNINSLDDNKNLFSNIEILNNLLKNVKQSVYLNHFNVTNLKLNSLLMDSVNFDLDSILIERNNFMISNIRAYKDSSYAIASLSTIKNDFFLKLIDSHINESLLYDLDSNNNFINIKSDVFLNSDSIFFSNSKLDYQSSTIEFDFIETQYKYYSNINNSTLCTSDFSIFNRYFNTIDTIITNGNILINKKDFNGHFNGLIDSEFGTLNFNIGFDSLFQNNYFTRAEIYFDYFNLGGFLNKDNLSTIKGYSIFEHSNQESSYTQISSHIKSINFNNYTYNNLYFTLLNNKKYDNPTLSINLADKNCKIDLFGNIDIDFQSDSLFIKSVDLDGKVNDINVSALNIPMNDLLNNVSSNIIVNLTFPQNPNQRLLDVNFSNFTYNYLDSFNIIDSINLSFSSLSNQSDVTNELFVNSSIGDLDLVLSKKKSLSFFSSPSFQWLDKFKFFKFNLDLVNPGLFSELFFKNLSLEEHLSINCIYEDQSPALLDVKSSGFSYYNFDANNLSIFFNQHDQTFDFSIEEIVQLDKKVLGNISFKTTMQSDSIGGFVFTYNNSNANNFGLIKGDVRSNVSDFDILFDSSSFLLINNQYWEVDSSSIISLIDSGLRLKNFTIALDEQNLKINGLLSENSDIKFNFQNFELSNFNPFISNQNISLNGLLNGSIAYNPFSFPVLISDFQVDDFDLNNTLLGTFKLTNYSSLDYDSLYALGSIFNTNDELLSFSAKYPLNGSQNIHADILFDNLPIRLLDPLIKPISQINGVCNGSLKIEGSTSDYHINGLAIANECSFNVPYLNTNYYNKAFNINFTQDSVIIDDILLIDSKHDTRANAKLYLQHTALSNMNYNIIIESDRLFLLNTDNNYNNDYYGRVFMDGNLSVRGDKSKTLLNINAVTQKGTELMFPLSKSREIGENQFLTFKSQLKNNVSSNLNTNKNPDFFLNFNVDVDNASKFQLIFDEQVGDIIKANGNGGFNLKIDDSGQLQIFGDFEVESGDYLFTLQDVITKSFEIDNGGSVLFNGDIYDATLDLNLLYNVQASLNTLNPEYNRKNKSPVICRMKMTERLFSPQIDFAIDIPNSDPIIDNSLESITNTDQKLLEQFLYLLIANSFLIQDDANIDYISNTLSTTGTELLSSQLSNWLSQTTDAFDLGFNWTPGTGDSLSFQQIELAVSKKLLDDRVTINGNVATPPEQSQANIIGDIDLEYDVFKDGKFKLRLFNRAEDYDPFSQSLGYEQGVSISFRKRFNNLKKMFSIKNDD